MDAVIQVKGSRGRSYAGHVVMPGVKAARELRKLNKIFFLTERGQQNGGDKKEA